MQTCLSKRVLQHSTNVQPISSLFYLQQRTARFHPKKIFFPTLKKIPRPPKKKKEHEFSNDTLHSLSHGEDWITKIRTSEYEKKHYYRSHPERYIQRMWSDILNVYLWLPVSKTALHKIRQKGTLDRYILTTPCRHLNSRLGERLRYRMLRVLERKEDEMITRAINGDQKALPIAYQIVMKQERDERNALRRRNNWLRQREGRQESKKRKWLRAELNQRIAQIQNGELPQKFEKQPALWEQVQTVIDDQQKLIQSQEQKTL